MTNPYKVIYGDEWAEQILKVHQRMLGIIQGKKVIYYWNNGSIKTRYELSKLFED